MKWSKEAEDLLGRVPFFVRKKVRKRVEEEVGRTGRTQVVPEDLQRAQRRYMERMSDEVRGYRLETCFGAGGCPHRAVMSEGLLGDLKAALEEADLKAFLEKEVEGPLRHHHELCVAVADCPNACSRPQIQGIGLIGARFPEQTGEPCSACGACVEACKEGAVALSGSPEEPFIDPDACLGCGACIEACPTGTLAEGRTGWRLLLGGKLGRHPHLADELSGLFSDEEVPALVRKALEDYKASSRGGERFSDFCARTGYPSSPQVIQEAGEVASDSKGSG